MTRRNASDPRIVPRFDLLFVLLLTITLNWGCGGVAPPDCSVAAGLAVAPQSASADHLAAPPGNQISFVGSDTPPPSCPPTPGAPRQDLTWSVSDPGHVTIGNTKGVDYGVATCKIATSAVVTVTATGSNKLDMSITGNASLTCK